MTSAQSPHKLRRLRRRPEQTGNPTAHLNLDSRAVFVVCNLKYTNTVSVNTVGSWQFCCCLVLVFLNDSFFSIKLFVWACSSSLHFLFYFEGYSLCVLFISSCFFPTLIVAVLYYLSPCVFIRTLTPCLWLFPAALLVFISDFSFCLTGRY